MRVAVSGTHGLIGSALSQRLAATGHDVVPIVRGAASGAQIGWDPKAGTIDARALEGADAVIHLAGAGVGDHRWTDSYKQEVLRSRTQGTTTLAHALASLSTPPKMLLSASAVGYYGVRGDEVLTEDSGPGSGFLADVCAQWEHATRPATEVGVRVVLLRSGVILSAAGGALKKQLVAFKLGLGARLGHGDHYLSWITRRDHVDAVLFLLNHRDAAGPVNVTAPSAVTNATFTKALGGALHRPAKMVLPSSVLRAAVGREMTSEFLLASQRTVPQRLVAMGFDFVDPSIDEALATALADQKRLPQPEL
jgi:hypothetical protein